MFLSLANLVRYRGLIWSLVARDLKARYRGSVLGFFWTFVNPLLLLLVYSFVFTTIMPNETPGVEPYALFMFCGILPWNWFSASLSEAAGSLIAGGNLIKKVLFPAEILPIVSVLANMVHFLLGLLILIPCPDLLPATALRVQSPVVSRGGLSCSLSSRRALALILSALTVHFRDIRDLLGECPDALVFFDADHLSLVSGERAPVQAGLFDVNPFTHLAISYQEILFFGPIGHWKWLLALGAGSVLLFLAGYWLFDRLRDSFAEAV